jgi:hypothetical protein
MHKFRFALLGAAAALALGTASAVAMQSNVAGTSDPDSHGDAVASAARTTCPHGPEGVHGKCVSAIASAEGKEKAESKETEAEASSSKVKACKAADKTEDGSEKKPAKGDKAAKAADHTEDKSEHKSFAACVSGQTAAATSS